MIWLLVQRLAVFCLLVCATAGGAAWAQNDTSAETAVADPPASARFELELQTTEALQTFLLPQLSLQRFRNLPDLDNNELQRLVDNAAGELRDLLGTLGHFSPTLETRLIPTRPNEWASDAPAAGTPPTLLGRVVLRIEPGPQALVASSEVFFKGDIATAPEAAALREQIRRNATLPSGATFTQAEWDRLKSTALRLMTAQRYPAGRIDNSLADVDAAQHRVNLYIELDSGPAVQVGALRMEGLQRYDPQLIEHMVQLAGITPGSDYSLEKLQAAQQRLAQSAYFDSVFVYMDLNDNPAATPVVVQVRETQRQMLVLGVGGSTDKGPRLSLEHTHHRVPGVHWRAVHTLQLENSEQQASSTWSAPVNERGWRWVSSARASRQLDTTTTTTSQRLRAGQAQSVQEMERSFFVQYDRARTVNLLQSTDAPIESSVSANYAWTRQRFVNPLRDPSGDGLHLELGAGTTLSDNRRPFVRAQTRWQGYWPVGAALNVPDVLGQAASQASPRRAARLAWKLHGGALWAQADAPVPETQLFLTGGDTTVRGYGLRTIGVPQADGSILAGRYMVGASLEWQRVRVQQGQVSPWEQVLFVDTGAVTDNPRSWHPRWGVGSGLRYNSPVGPLQMDLAYGLERRRLRLHLNVGLSF